MLDLLLVLCVCKIVISLEFEKPEKRQEMVVERDCNMFGPSVGRLEWRSLVQGDQLTVRCDLNDADVNLNYAISWTYGFDADSRNVLQLCEFNNKRFTNTSEIFCEYTHPIRTEDKDKRLICRVKTDNVWNSESRTACVSEEIPLITGTYESSRTTNMTTSVTNKSFIEGLRVDETYLTSISEENGDEEFLWKLEQPTRSSGRYQVETGADIMRTCPLKLEDNSTEDVIWRFSGRPHLDRTPQSMEWKCNISYAGRLKGSFTLYISKGIINSKSNQITDGILLKRCHRSPEIYILAVTCSLTLSLSDNDLGQHVVAANFRYVNSEKARRSKEFQYCNVIDDFINYNVTRDPKVQSSVTPPMLYLVERRERLANISLRTNRTLDLPYNSAPKGNKGVRLNGKQFLILAVSGILVGCFLGFLYARWRSAKRLQAEALETRRKIGVRRAPGPRAFDCVC